MTHILLIGCGHMGSALVKGWMTLENTPFTINVLKPTPDFVDPFVASHVTHIHDPALIRDHDGPIILAVKPAMMRSVLNDIKPYLSGQPILSVAAGITIDQYKEILPEKSITRVMPSLPAAVHQSLSPIHGDDLSTAKALFDPLGGTIVLHSDKDMDIATILLGCGPGYFAQFLETLKDSAVKLGLEPATAHQFVRAVSTASMDWLKDKEDYKAAAESLGREGSMTKAALDVLADRHMPDMIKAALEAALSKAETISRNF